MTGYAGVEASHFASIADALNLVVDYRPESTEQIMEWVLEGFEQFMSLLQEMFCRVDEESQSFVNHLTEESKLVLI